MIVVTALAGGILLGLFFPYTIPSAYSQYFAIGILAALDSVFGAISASLAKTFNLKVFLVGMFSNALLAALLTFIGTRIDVDLYLAAIFVFGTRLFQNLAIIRRFLLNKYVNRDKN